MSGYLWNLAGGPFYSAGKAARVSVSRLKKGYQVANAIEEATTLVIETGPD